MFSGAPFSDGVLDGIEFPQKYFTEEDQSVMVLGNNRVGVILILIDISGHLYARKQPRVG